MMNNFKPTFSHLRIIHNDGVEVSITNGLYTYQWLGRVQKTRKKLKELGDRIDPNDHHCWVSVQNILNTSGFYKVSPPKKFKWFFEGEKWVQSILFSIGSGVNENLGIDPNVWEDKDTKYVVVFPSIDTVNWLNELNDSVR